MPTYCNKVRVASDGRSNYNAANPAVTKLDSACLLHYAGTALSGLDHERLKFPQEAAIFGRGFLASSLLTQAGPGNGRTMGWSYRKSVHLGPFRVNLSKTGIGYSLGAKDFRVGVNSRGRRYESITVPGTGLSYRTSGKSRSQAGGCAPAVLLVAAVVASGIYEFVFSH